MLENYSITWGGIGNLLVPVDEAGDINAAFWPVLDVFDADEWAAYVITRRGMQLANPDGFEQWLSRQASEWVAEKGRDLGQARQMFSEDHLMSSPRGGWPPADLLKAELHRRTAPSLEYDGDVLFSQFRADGPPGNQLTDVRDLEPLPDQVTLLDTESLPMSVRVLLAMRMGGLSPSHADGLRKAGVGIESLPVDEHNLEALLGLAWYGPPPNAIRYAAELAGESSDDGIRSGALLQECPLHLSTVGCLQMRRSWSGQHLARRAVVVGSHADDFSYAMALDRCGLSVAWLPEDLALGDDELATIARRSITTGLALRHEEPKEVIIRSLTMSKEAVTAVAAKLREAPFGAGLTLEPVDRIDLPPYRLPALLDPRYYDEPLEEPFGGDDMVRAVPAVIPSAVASSDSWKLMWWTEVSASESALPPRASLNDLVIVDTESWRARTRCGRDGVSYPSHSMGFVPAGSLLEQMIERPRLRFPGAQAAFQHLFTKAGYSSVESAAGRFRRLSIELWGSLQAFASDLEHSETIALLRGWLAREPSGENPGVFTNTRRYLTLDDSAELSGLAVEEVRAIVDRYLSRGIVRRGYLLKCGHCLHLQWYDLSDLGQSFQCGRCRTSTTITQETWRRGSEPPTYYDLAEVARQALGGNVEVPIAALTRLQARAASFAETSEMEVTGPDGNKVEIDLLAICDGRIILGEAKTSDHLHSTASAERAWLSRFSSVANAICADEAVFATASAGWRQPTIERIHEAFPETPGGVRVRLLGECSTGG